jgi:formylglycine-generating enzyme required for sulfatase activity
MSSDSHMAAGHAAADPRSAGDFVRIPEGWFQMGSEDGPDDERPVHRVRVDAFDMAVYPVTCAQYDAFLRATGHELPRDWVLFATAPDLPVVGVSWQDCGAYCHWRNETDPVDTNPVDSDLVASSFSRKATAAGRPGLRLPTEAEWERAARGGVDGRRYPWGDEIPGWIPDGGRGPLAGPWPVMLGDPNAFGVYGIAANIHEWCADWYSAGFYSSSCESNPQGPQQGVRRASRGGSWRHAVTISRSAARSRIDPSFRYTDYGFRLVRSATCSTAA